AGHGLTPGGCAAKSVPRVEGGSRAMPLTTVKTAVFLLLTTVGLGLAGAGVLAHREAEPGREAAPQAKTKEPPETKPAGGRAEPEPFLVEQGDRGTITGRVLGPDGKPFAGANLNL